jgi:hypothetical protein
MHKDLLSTLSCFNPFLQLLLFFIAVGFDPWVFEYKNPVLAYKTLRLFLVFQLLSDLGLDVLYLLQLALGFVGYPLYL